MPNQYWSTLADEFRVEHRSEWNEVCHFVSIPLIFLAFIRWTQVFPPYHVFPWIALLLLLYYFWSIRMGIAMTVALIVMAAISYYFLTPWSALAIFIVGVVFELIGHQAFEKNYPVVTKNVLHVFVGPGWVLQKFVKKTIGVNLWPQAS